MKTLINELAALNTGWAELTSQRPGEGDFSAWGYDGLSFEAFGKAFTEWRALTEKVIAGGSLSRPKESHILIRLSATARMIRTLRASIDQGKANGVGHMLKATEFLGQAAAIDEMVGTFGSRAATWKRELQQLARSKAGEDVALIERASPLARTLIDEAASISAASTKVAGLEASAVEEAAALAELRSKIEIASREIGDMSLRAEGDKKQLTDIAATFAVTSKEAVRVLGELEDRKKVTFDELSKGDAAVAQAREKLTRALEDINRQALSGSFDYRARELGKERVLWLAPFMASIAGLFFISYNVLGLVATKDTDTAFRELLKGIPLAAPLVWLGWFSAKNIGVVGRLKADYEFKAATAVAFEGYKKEIVASNDEALAKQLLETAVKNFGENPSRLYRDAQEDSVIPIEALAKTLKDETLWNRFVEMLKLLKSK